MTDRVSGRTARTPVRVVAVALLAAGVLAGCRATPPGASVDPAAPSATAVPRQPDAEGLRWVEETLASLSLREQVAQLVIEWIPGGYTAPSAPDFEPLARWVADDGIGGVSPSIGTPHAYVAKLNALQRRAEVPLLVTSDFENGGPGMRLSGTYALPSMLPQGGGTNFPPTMAFGAIDDERFAYEYGRITAREARATGVHVLFAPVLDVNSNPDNPVINTRAFGGDPDLVARMGAAFIRGARDGGALTTGKHFPGHGDTSTDSHLDLPLVDADRARLDALELVPFVRALAEGVDAIMTAHVSVPDVVGSSEPATLSPEFMTGLLRADLGFDGLLFTDAMAMRAITDGYGIGEASVRAVEAGADVILSPRDVPAAIEAVVGAVEQGRLTPARIEASVRRILVLKARMGLHRNRYVSLDAVDEVVGSGAHLAFADSAASRSIVLVRDRGALVPMDAAGAGRVAHVVWARSSWPWADRTFGPGLLERVAAVDAVRLDERSDSAAYARAHAVVEGADRVLVSAYVSAGAGSDSSSVPAPLRRLVAAANASKPTVVVSFGNPYLLSAFPATGSLLLAWGDRPVSQQAALKAVFGEEAVSGRLPIGLPPHHDLGHGLDRAKVSDFRPAVTVEDPLVAAGIADRGDRGPTGAPQAVADATAVAMDANALGFIDAVVEAALADSAASGVAVAIGRHGRLVKLDGYGELAYGSGRPVTPTSIWDMASVSKVVGTTTMAMRLVGEGRLSLDDRVVEYLPWWSRGDPRKEQVTIRQLLLHRTGLIPFRRWYLELPELGLQAYKDAAADEPLQEAPDTRTAYSDIGIMTLGWVLEEITGQTLDDYLRAEVWRPLGMLDTDYTPDPGLRPRIATTEMDTVWRGEMVWGRVHDENADAMGGVAGHAGLFSTAVDLSVFARMMLNGGVAPACSPGDLPGEPCPVARPAPVRVVDAEVLDRFTTRFDASSTRALGWDTPGPRSSGGDYVTAEAFGHTGYTGTSIWMDPELDLWVIVLTNRVHPTRENTKHVALRRAIADAAALAITDVAVSPREGG
ncbi:MAG: glycoside hydrolase family 3 N-terminal domain-containing protein [Longimicrobiales bacterium]